jgi:hypothetical protein
MLQKLTLFFRRHLNPSPRRLLALAALFTLACALVGWRVAATARPQPTRTPVYLPGSQPTGGPALALNLYIAEEAAYQLTSADLQAAGFDAAPNTITLTWRGQPVPLDITSDETGYRLRFYGQASGSRYTRENVYQLQAGQPLTMTTITPPASSSAAAGIYTATLRSEENSLYAPQASGGDGWFGKMIPAKKSHAFAISLDALAAGPTLVRLAVWSDTQAELAPDHHLQVMINGQVALDATWDGSGRQVLQAVAPAGLLAAGVNQVEVLLPGDTGITAERSYFDWLEIDYPRPATAENGLALLPGAGVPIQFDGFDAATHRLWQIDGITQTTRLLGSLIPGELGARYIVVGPQGFRTPRLQALTATPDLRQLPPAQYLAFGPDDLLAAAQPLLTAHQQNGLTTAAIPLQAVYDQFGQGFPEPAAIQRFLAYAAAQWPAPPRYVLLLGDFTYDPRGYIVGPEANRLPSFFVHTVYGGETASDVPMADLDADGLPDLAVGRLPARSSDEIAAYSAKAIAYMQQSDTAWRTRLLAVADGQEASFASDAQTFLDRFDGELRSDAAFAQTLFAPPAGVQDANTQVASSFEEGFGLVSYFGHGSLAMWGKDRLFTSEDVATLKNGDHLPVVVNMNCLTGLFTHPKTASLAEVFLWQPQGGAVAVLAPTSLTLPGDQSLLSGALAEQFSSYPRQSLGESLLNAQRQMPIQQAGANEVLLTFLLFGDPALQPWAALSANP